jgi:hypothetical protein
VTQSSRPSSGEEFWTAPSLGLSPLSRVRLDELLTELLDRVGDVMASREPLSALLQAVVGVGTDLDLHLATIAVPRSLSSILDGRTRTSARAGRRYRAIATALPTLEEVADRWWDAMALVELGKAHALQRRKAEAVAAWEKALPAIEETGNDRVLSDVRGRMSALAGR